MSPAFCFDTQQTVFSLARNQLFHLRPPRHHRLQRWIKRINHKSSIIFLSNFFFFQYVERYWSDDSSLCHKLGLNIWGNRSLDLIFVIIYWCNIFAVYTLKQTKKEDIHFEISTGKLVKACDLICTTGAIWVLLYL